MNYHSIQMRFPEEKIMCGAQIEFKGTTYTLGQTMPETIGRDSLPIGVVMTGYTCQFELLHEGRRAGAAWFYFYGSLERVRWAVLDELELYGVAEDGRAA